MAPATFRAMFPPPWRIEDVPGGFKVVSSNGFALAYIYARDKFARSADPTALGHREALALAKAIARLADQ